MERLKKIIIGILFMCFPLPVWTYDLSGVEKHIAGKGFEGYIYSIIKNVIEYGDCEKIYDATRYVLDDSEVIIMENSFTKTHGRVDIGIFFKNLRYGIPHVYIMYIAGSDYFQFGFRTSTTIIRTTSNHGTIIEFGVGIINSMDF